MFLLIHSYPFILSWVWLVHSSIHSFFNSLTPLHIHSPIHLCIHCLIHTCSTYLHSFIYLFILNDSCTHSFCHSFTHSFIRSWLYWPALSNMSTVSNTKMKKWGSSWRRAFRDRCPFKWRHCDLCRHMAPEGLGNQRQPLSGDEVGPWWSHDHSRADI